MALQRPKSKRNLSPRLQAWPSPTSLYVRAGSTAPPMLPTQWGNDRAIGMITKLLYKDKFHERLVSTVLI
jgi:hypothetical protein